MHLGSPAIEQGALPPGVAGVGTQATDLGMHQAGLQVCAEAAYPVFIVQGLREWGRKKPWLLWRIL